MNKMIKQAAAPYTPRKRTGGRHGQLGEAEAVQFAVAIADLMAQGYSSYAAISRKLNTTVDTVGRYMERANLILASFAPEKGQIRSLEQQRCYRMIERLTKMFKECHGVAEKTGVANAIHKWSTHLAAISGLTVEVNATIDPTQLVIIRSSEAKPKIVSQDDMIEAGVDSQ